MKEFEDYNKFGKENNWQFFQQLKSWLRICIYLISQYIYIVNAFALP